MKLEVTNIMVRSLRNAAQHAVTDRAHNPEISFDCATQTFAFGSNLCRGSDEIDFVNEFDLAEFVSNWFGDGAPSRFTQRDARHCIEQCIAELEDRVEELAEQD